MDIFTLAMFLWYVDIWNAKCVSREMEIWSGFQQNIECRFNVGWLAMLLDHLDFIFRTNMQLVSREHNKDCLILFTNLCKFTRFRVFEVSTLCCGVVHEQTSTWFSR